MKTPAKKAGARWIKKLVGNKILVPIAAARKSIRDRLCRRLCGDRLFNSDMSLELDRKQAEVDYLRERLDAVARMPPDED